VNACQEIFAHIKPSSGNKRLGGCKVEGLIDRLVFHFFVIFPNCFYFFIFLFPCCLVCALHVALTEIGQLLFKGIKRNTIFNQGI